jgi:ribosomal protein RSM22 (predicted rRNA methylase)
MQAPRVRLIANATPGLTGDTLVLVEPGTPAGFANIADARAALLTREARKAAKVARRAAAAGVRALRRGVRRRSGLGLRAPCTTPLLRIHLYGRGSWPTASPA